MANYVQFAGTSAANTAQTVSTGTGTRYKVRWITVAYSAAPTQTGVTIALDSSQGAAYDTDLYTGSANVRYTFWQPDDDFPILGTDQIDVTAPAAGGAITSSIVIMCEVG